MKKRNVILVTLIVVLGVAFLAFVGWIVLGYQVKQTDDLSYYQALTEKKNGEIALPVAFSGYVECPYELPALEELDPYKQLRFNHMSKRVSIFSCHSYVLVASFDEAAYADQKTKLVEKYTFCPPKQDKIMSGYAYNMDGFEIRAVEGGEYPHQMLFIGCNDDSREIAIVYYYDQDLDGVTQPLGKFLTEETGWTQIIS